jgi:hypothetical protein
VYRPNVGIRLSIENLTAVFFLFFTRLIVMLKYRQLITHLLLSPARRLVLGAIFCVLLSTLPTVARVTPGNGGGGGGEESCGIPTQLSGQLTGTDVVFGWQPVPGATAYELEYRRIDLAGWQTVTTYQTSVVLYGLQPGTTYFWRVRTLCSSGTSDKTNNQFIQTPRPENNGNGVGEGRLFSMAPPATVTDGNTTLDFRSAPPNEPIQVSVVNFAGQEMARQTVRPTLGTARVQVDFSGLPNGIYRLHAQNAFHRVTHPLQVAR